MKIINYILLMLLCTGVVHAMDKLGPYQKVMALRHYMKSCKNPQELHEFMQQHNIPTTQLLDVFQEQPKPTLRIMQQPKKVETSSLTWNPMTWTGAFYNALHSFFVTPQPQPQEIELPCIGGFNWDAPYSIEDDGSMYIQRRGATRYLTVAGSGFVDVHNIDNRDKVICYEPEDDYSTTTWSDDGTVMAVLGDEEPLARVFDLTTEKPRDIFCGDMAVDDIPLRNFGDGDMRFFAQEKDFIAITDVRQPDEIPIIVSRPDCTITAATLRANLLIVAYSDNKVVIYDHNENYKQVHEVQGKKYVRLAHAWNDEKELPYVPLFVDDEFIILDKKTFRELYRNKQIIIGRTEVELSWQMLKEKPYMKVVMRDNRPAPHGVTHSLHDLATKRVVQLNGLEAFFNSTGSYIISFSLSPIVINIFDPKTEDGKPVKVFDVGHCNRIYLPDHDWIVMAVKGDKVEAYDYKNNKTYSMDHDGKAFCFFPEGKYYAWTTGEKEVVIFELADQTRKTLKLDQPVDPQQLMFDKKRGHLAVSHGDFLSLYDAATGNKILTMNLESSIKKNGMAFDPEGEVLTVVTEKKPQEVWLYDARDEYKPIGLLKYESDIAQADFWEDLFYVQADMKRYFYMREQVKK